MNSLISGWLELGEAKPPRQDLVGLCRISLWGVGYVKILVHILKKPNTSSWVSTSQCYCPKGVEMYRNSVAMCCICLGVTQLWAGSGGLLFGVGVVRAVPTTTRFGTAHLFNWNLSSQVTTGSWPEG